MIDSTRKGLRKIGLRTKQMGVEFGRVSDPDPDPYPDPYSIGPLDNTDPDPDPGGQK